MKSPPRRGILERMPDPSMRFGAGATRPGSERCSAFHVCSIEELALMKRLCLSALVAVIVLVQSVLGAELNPAKLAAVRTRMQQFVDEGEIAGAVTLVARHDRVVSLEAVGYQDLDAKKPMKADSLFRIASMTKPITAVGIMILVDEGKLAIDDPVEKYLPEFHGQPLAVRGKSGVTLQKPSRPITLRDLLTHTSGMPGGLPQRPAGLYEKRDVSLADAVRQFAKEPLQFEPGTKWQYCNIGIDTLGRIIEVASGQSYEAFLQKRIFGPLGMVDTCFYPSPAQAERIAVTYRKDQGKLVATTTLIIGPTAGAKYPIPAGGLYSTAADLARFYQMVLNQGERHGQRILTPASVARMTRVHTGDLTAGFTAGVGFGLGWGVVRTPTDVTAMLSPGTFGHGGAFGTQGWIDPQKDLIFVLMIQRVGLPNGDASDMRREFQRLTVSALGD
jgi:CubicO group peptidase (beta-lactamase class C family)